MRELQAEAQAASRARRIYLARRAARRADGCPARAGLSAAVYWEPAVLRPHRGQRPSPARGR